MQLVGRVQWLDQLVVDLRAVAMTATVRNSQAGAPARSEEVLDGVDSLLHSLHTSFIIVLSDAPLDR